MSQFSMHVPGCPVTLGYSLTCECVRRSGVAVRDAPWKPELGDFSEVPRLRAENERLRKELDRARVLGDVPNEGWCYSCGDLAVGDDVAPIVYRLRARVAAVEALLDAEEERVRLANERFAARGLTEPKSGTPLRIVGVVPVAQIRAALDGESS